ncbi:MAG: glycosyl transferase [Thermoleophilia bacterium]|nr:glycosyl transferase [Thermoleophilia bacterium]
MTIPTAIDLFVFGWYLLLSVGYMTLCTFAIRAGRAELDRTRRRSFDAAALCATPSQPAVSMLVPAHNERASIELSLRGLLSQRWHNLETLVICNGCTDDTLEVLRVAFDLVPTADSFERGPSGVGQVRSSWASTTVPSLRVIDIGVGGKADALNCGLERARGTYVCTVDADSLLAPDAVAHVILPFAEVGSDVVAVGSVVRVLNGAEVVDGRVVRPGMPRSWRARIQVVEYARGFHLGRAGWAEIGALPIISGAFAAFRTSALRVAGGFRADMIGEDMEVVLRLHDRFRPRRGRDSILFVPRPLCWTEVPEDAATLRRQRERWQHGLLEAAKVHRRQVFGGGGTRVGRSALPFVAVFEAYAPLIELVGLAGIVIALILGQLSAGGAAALLLFAVALGVLLSAVGILLEQVVGGHYLARPRDALILLSAALLEQLGPRQRTAWWRLRALLGARPSGTAGWDGMHHGGAAAVAGSATPRAWSVGEPGTTST